MRVAHERVKIVICTRSCEALLKAAVLEVIMTKGENQPHM